MRESFAGFTVDRRRHAAGVRRCVLSAALFPCALGEAADARAEDVTPVSVSPGFLLSGVVGKDSAAALGGEASFMVYPKSLRVGEDSHLLHRLGVGGFAQAQAYLPDRARYAVGLQAGTFLGVEVGDAYEPRSATFAGLHAIHAAVFASIGFVAISVRGSVPVATLDEDRTHPSPGAELAFCLALKFPFFVRGEPNLGLDFHNGRAFREGGRAVMAGVGRDPSFARGPRPRVAHLTSRDRARLWRVWVADGLAEHASIASFVRLARELHALGAPTALVARALAAADQELVHARLCFALASGYAGASLSPGPWPCVPPRMPSLATVADEAMRDGAIGEAAAATAASEAANACADPAVGAVLKVLARDEAEHARLSFEVLAFARARGHVPTPRSLPLAAARAGEARESRAWRSSGRLGRAREVALLARARDLALC